MTGFPPDKLESALLLLANLLFSEKEAGRNSAATDKIREEQFVGQINAAFNDPDVADEQYLMAEAVANYTEIEELPW